MPNFKHLSPQTLFIALVAICALVAAAMMANSALAEKDFGYQRIDISQEQWLSSDKQKAILLDVRTPKEYQQGHIKGAINIPHTELAKRLEELGKDKNQQVVVYCRSGKRAGKAEAVLAANGFTNINHLDGDMNGWLAAKRPVETCTQC